MKRRSGSDFSLSLFCIVKPRDGRVVQKNLSGGKEIKTSFAIMKRRCANGRTKSKGRIFRMSRNEINSCLSHAKWNCKYPIVFARKYRRNVFYGGKREAVGKILRQRCEWKGVTIVEAEGCPDHVHMLAEIPSKTSVSSFMGYLKGKSSTML